MARGYIIARVRIDDAERYKQYMAESPGALGAFGGKFLVRGGQHQTVEGETETRRLVVVEFPSYAKAQECYASDIYRKVKALRDGAGEAQFILVEGYDP
ncbi:MAG: DUF1330 domain-containing protein [Pikeienuella sp.]